MFCLHIIQKIDDKQKRIFHGKNFHFHNFVVKNVRQSYNTSHTYILQGYLWCRYTTGIYQPCTYMLHVGILPHAHINTQYIHIQVEKFISGIYKSQTRRQNIPFNVWKVEIFPRAGFQNERIRHVPYLSLYKCSFTISYIHCSLVCTMT